MALPQRDIRTVAVAVLTRIRSLPHDRDERFSGRAFLKTCLDGRGAIASG